jgi:group I intron endonuclease
MFSLKARYNRHFSKNNKSAVSLSIQKYGKGNFKFEVLVCTKSQEVLNELEEYFINLHNTMSPNGYNIIHGGKNGKRTEETKLAHSKRMKGIKFMSRRRGIIATHRDTKATIEVEVVRDFLNYGFTKNDLSNIRWCLAPITHKTSVKNYTFKYKNQVNSDLITESNESVAVQRIDTETVKSE